MQFINYNANPRGRKTSDCVIRAICTALNNTWEDTYRSLVDYSIKQSLMCNEKRALMGYLKAKGYEMKKMPKHKNNTRYTIAEFIDTIAEPKATYILSVANHLTTVRDKTLLDTFNCGKKFVGNYWQISSGGDK